MRPRSGHGGQRTTIGALAVTSRPLDAYRDMFRLDESDLTAGDFVRWIKQLIDLAGQVADAAGPGALRGIARDVVRRIRRGVVAVAPMED